MTSLAARLASLPPGAVDVHTHVIDPDLADVGVRFAGAFPTVERVDAARARIHLDGAVYREVDERAWSPAARLRDMDAEGVAAQVVSPVPVTLCHGEPSEGAAALAQAQNEFIASFVAHAPSRFYGLGAVPLQDVDLAVYELRRCVTDLGFVGVEIGTRVGQRELADPAFEPFFAEAARLSAIVLVHPVDRTLDPRLAALGVGFGLGMPAETATAAAGLLTSGSLAAAPGLCLCLAHGGGALPSVLPRVAFGQRILRRPGAPTDAMSAARGMWCDSLTYDVDSLLLAVTRFGGDHVLLGTDYPFAARETPAGAVLEAAGSRLPDGIRGAIARDNCVALMSAVARARADVPSVRGAVS